jgi:hypothetical protein
MYVFDAKMSVEEESQPPPYRCMSSFMIEESQPPAIIKRKTYKPTFEVIAPVEGPMCDLGDEIMTRLVKLGANPYHWGDPSKPKDMACLSWMKGFILVYDQLMRNKVLMKITHYQPGMGIPLVLQHYTDVHEGELDMLLEQSYWIYGLEDLINKKYSTEQLLSIRRRSQNEMKWRNALVNKNV